MSCGFCVGDLMFATTERRWYYGFGKRHGLRWDLGMGFWMGRSDGIFELDTLMDFWSWTLCFGLHIIR